MSGCAQQLQNVPVGHRKSVPCVCMCGWVCARARVFVCVCVCVCTNPHAPPHTRTPHLCTPSAQHTYLCQFFLLLRNSQITGVLARVYHSGATPSLYSMSHGPYVSQKGSRLGGGPNRRTSSSALGSVYSAAHTDTHVKQKVPVVSACLSIETQLLKF